MSQIERKDLNIVNDIKYLQRKYLRETVKKLLSKLQEEIDNSRLERGKIIYLDFLNNEEDSVVLVQILNIEIMHNGFYFKCYITTDDKELDLGNIAICTDKNINIIMETADKITNISMTWVQDDKMIKEEKYLIV